MPSIPRRVRDFADSSSRQTFLLLPAAVLLFESARHRRRPRLDWRFLPVCVGGYLLYELCGRYRERNRAGGRGFANLPVRLLSDGPYAWSRNPMYLGHLICSFGLLCLTRSPLALLLFLERITRFHSRVVKDEQRLLEIFGDEYRDYLRRVPRWVPELF